MYKNKFHFLFSKNKMILDERMKDALIWSLIGQILSRTINLISTIILARLMDPEGYGKYIYLIGTLMFFSQIFSLSIRSTSTRNIAFLISKDKIQAQKYIFTSLFLGSFFSFFSYLILSLAVYSFQENIVVKEYGLYILLITFTAIISEIAQPTILGILEGLKSFKFLNLLTIFISFFKFILSYFGWVFYNIEGAIIGWVLASIIGLFLFFKPLNSSLKHHNINLKGIKYNECKKEIKLYFNFSIPSSIEAGILMFSIWIIQTFIMDYGNHGKKEIALFNIANQWRYLIIYLPAILINMTQSFFSEFLGQGADKNAENLFLKIKKFTFIFSALLIIFFLLISKWIVKFYGDGYTDAYIVLIILIPPVLFTNINALKRQYLMSKGKVWLITINNLIAGVSIIIFFLIFKNYYSLSISFAISIGLGEIFIYLIYLFIFRNFSLKYLINYKK